MKDFSLRTNVWFSVILVSAAGFNPAPVSAAEQYDYPELSVVPRASDRLQSEAEQESGNRWTTFLPMQVSALTTLGAGITSLDPVYPTNGVIGIGVGGGWLLVTTVMALAYHPYSSSNANVSPL